MSREQNLTENTEAKNPILYFELIYLFLIIFIKFLIISFL